LIEENARLVWLAMFILVGLAALEIWLFLVVLRLYEFLNERRRAVCASPDVLLGGCSETPYRLLEETA